jgi:DnaJ-class molecular chaperone
MNYYQILNINKNANLNEIKQAYYKLALIYHPDKSKDKINDELIFKKINEAYDILSNPEKKYIYDTHKTISLSQKKLKSLYNI